MKIQPWEQMTEREENRIVAILTLLAIVVFLTVTAKCGELPKAPEPQTEHLFSRTNVLLFSANAGLRVTDSVVSCQSAGYPHWKEQALPFQSCGVITAWNLAMIPAQIGTVALLQHFHHNKLARIAAVAFPAVDLPSVIYTATHKGSFRAPAPVLRGNQ